MAFVENSRAGKLGLHDFDLYGQTVNSQRLRGAVTDVDAMGICCTKWLWSTARTGRLALLVSGEIPENAPASFLQPTTRLGLAPESLGAYYEPEEALTKSISYRSCQQMTWTPSMLP